MRIPTRTVVAILAAVTSVSIAAREARAQRCTQGFTPETTRLVFDTLRTAHDPECTFEGVGTEGPLLEARFTRGGRVLPAVSFHLEDCDVPGRAPRLESSVPVELATACPSVARAATALAPEIASRRFAGEAPTGGSVPRIAAIVCMLVAIAFGLVAARRGVRRFETDDRAWAFVALGGFALALAIRTALPSAPSNWYLDFLPPRGPPTSTRFGATAIALPYLLRAVHLWSEPMLFALGRCAGAMAAPLVVWIVHESRGGVRAAAVAAALVAIDPLHARVSASGSEHAIASSLTLATMATWLCALRTRDRWFLSLSAVLALLAAGARIDATPQLFAIPAWSVLRDRIERSESDSRRRSIRDAALAYAYLALVTASTWWFVARPAKHPSPSLADVAVAARHLFSQYWTAAHGDPRWIAVTWVGATLAASVVLAVRRPWLLARVVVVLACTFVPLGRTIDRSHLIELRYFLFAFAIAQLPIAFAIDLAVEQLKSTRLRVVATGAASLLLAAMFVFETRSAFAVRFTYEDEYAFLSHALARVPAGCAVVATPQRLLLPADADCCLDVPNSPIVLRYPALNFVRLDRFPLDRASLGSCAVYYESPLCEGEPRDRRWHDEIARYSEACRAQRSRGTFEPIGEQRVSPRTSRGMFDQRAPTARLFRWQP